MRPFGRTLTVAFAVVPICASLVLAAPASAQEVVEDSPIGAGAQSAAPTQEPSPSDLPVTVTPAPSTDADITSPAPTITADPAPSTTTQDDVVGPANPPTNPRPSNTPESPGGTVAVHGEEANPVESKASPNWGRFAELGGAARLGNPIGDEVVRPDGTRILRFPNAALITGRTTGTRLLEGQILQRYLAIGGPDSPIGLPITDEGAGGRGSRAVLFERGRIYSSGATGTFEVYGAILYRYLALNVEHGVLGLPTSAEYSGAGDSRVQSFQGGKVIWTPAYGSHEVYGSILQKYDAVGAEGGVLGPPKSGEVNGPAGTRMSYFKNGNIYHGVTGTHEVFGAILGRYLAEGGPSGQLGLPTSGEEGWDYGRISRFQYGTITWNAFNGEVRSNFAVNPAWLRHPRTGAPFNANVARWAPTVVKALTDNGVPTYYTPGVLAQIQQESGGNPNAVNTWDINWQNGYASFGLLQTIAPTYQSFAPPGQRGNVTWINVNGRSQRYVPEMVMPYNNIYAGINYAKTRYGMSRLNSWNSGYNYAYGQPSIPAPENLIAE